MDTAYRKIAPVARSRDPLENRILRPIVEEQVLGEELGRFVKILHRSRATS
jgi:hypothetical protein